MKFGKKKKLRDIGYCAFKNCSKVEALDIPEGVKMIGATAHYVTKDLDEGPIIEQDIEAITHHDSIDQMIEIGRDIERKVLLRAVRSHLNHKILIHNKRTIIFHGLDLL